jgi:hypothetical protein
VSVIIPSGDASRSETLERLLDDLKQQSRPPDEVEVVRGVSPSGHARNLGVGKTRGDILVFFDDDVRLGTPDLVETFVRYLTQDRTLGIVGAAQRLPPDSSRFQQRSAAQISRSESPVVDELTESDMVTTACWALRREVLEEVGGYHDRIPRGVDPELRERVRKAGYRIAVVPQTWFYHPMPKDLATLARVAYRNGAASAFARRHFPEAVIYNPEGHVAEFEARPPLSKRVLRNLGGLARNLVAGRWYGAAWDLAYLAGNLFGARQGR